MAVIGSPNLYWLTAVGATNVIGSDEEIANGEVSSIVDLLLFSSRIILSTAIALGTVQL